MRALDRVRAHGRLLLAGSLCVDVVLLLVVRHHFSSVSAVEVTGSVFAVLSMFTGLLAGVEAGLAVGLFTGTVFYLFVAPLNTMGRTETTILGIVVWNLATVLVAVLARNVPGQIFDLASSNVAGRHTVVLPLPNDSAVELRVALRAMLADRDVDEPTCDQVVLAAQEAYNNAVVHPPGTVEVSAAFSVDRITIDVRDHGPGFDAAGFLTDRVPDPTLPRGRGLFLMHKLMDDIEIDASPEGTRVRLVKRISRRRAVTPRRAPPSRR